MELVEQLTGPIDLKPTSRDQAREVKGGRSAGSATADRKLDALSGE